jgi:hypothetical protein
MTKISKAVMGKITAEYAPLHGTVFNPGRIAFFYGAVEVLAVSAGGSTWFLPINKGRQGRPVEVALKAILTETKIGKKIIHRVQRILVLEQHARKKA